MGLLASAFGLGIAVVLTVIFLALRQPSPGVAFSLAADAKEVLVTEPGLSPKAVARIRSENGEIDLLPLDLTVEPDGAMGNYATYERFLARQDQLSSIQRGEELSIELADGEKLELTAEKARRWSSLPAAFWVQLSVGLVSFLVSAGVFAFRPRSAAARYLLLSGFATLMFAPAAALYSTRELALPGELFRWANDLNFLGGSLFAASFVALLLHYPRKLAPWWLGLSVVCLFVAWFGAQQLGAFESMTFARRFLVLIGVFTTFGLAGIHWFGTRRDPVARAALQWFLLSWIVGTGLFSIGILLPQLFGYDTSRFQGYAFLLFLLVYAGLAFGILRYRLFEMGDWWPRLLAWSTAVFLLVTVYLSLVAGLQLSPGLALALALLFGGIFWVFLRSFLRENEGETPGTRPGELFGCVLGIALGAEENQETAWKQLLNRLFEPLDLQRSTSNASAVTISDDGATLLVPAVGLAGALRLEFPGHGSRLFSRADASLAAESREMLLHALESRDSYDKGVFAERSRIALDMHDNIASQLLSALHSPEAARKDQRIRETMREMREMLRNYSSERLTLEESMAELRVETADRLAAKNIVLHWQCGDVAPGMIGPGLHHSLRSVIREAVSNIIKHSAASQADISLILRENALILRISDDGCGFDPALKSSGSGLANFHGRLQPYAGEVDISPSANGTTISAKIPLKKGTSTA